MRTRGSCKAQDSPSLAKACPCCYPSAFGLMLANGHALANSGEKEGKGAETKKGGGSFQAKREIIQTNKMPLYCRFVNVHFVTLCVTLSFLILIH